MYSALVKQAGPADQYCFVTSNHRDFSMPNGDHRQPHPDLAELFNGMQSHFVYQLEGLDALLSECLSDEFEEFIEEREEVEFLENAEEPRTLAEIVDAEAEFFDKVWYVRSIVGSPERDDAELPDDIREGNACCTRESRGEVWPEGALGSRSAEVTRKHGCTDTSMAS
jgi:hypothetical protein